MPTKKARSVAAELREQIKQVEQANDLLIAQSAKQAEQIKHERDNRDGLIASLEREREEHNRTRGLLMSSELAYAKLRGYVEGLEEAKPPRMIPEPRESGLARMPDGSQGTSGVGSADYYEMHNRPYGRGEPPKPWYYK